jgi:hypothetical protein
MATSGSKSVTVTSWNTLKFSWTVKSQSVANNTTTISWLLELIATSDGYISSTASKAWSVTVNGTNYSGTNTVGISNNSTKTLASGTTTIEHNSDGSKSFSYSFSQEFGITFQGSSLGTFSGSGSGTLNTIPRASQPSLVTWPETTNNVGEFGAEFSIHMNRKSDAFTHTVRYAYGDRSGTIATGVTTGTTWAVPLEFMNDIPTATKASGLIYVDTYNGSTKIGTKYTGFTVTVPASVKPTCNFTLTDTNGWDKTYGSPVQGLSKIKVTVNPVLAYSSPIASYSISIDGGKYTTATATTGVLKAAGSSVVSVTIKDKRGRSASSSYTMNVLAYALPNISKLTVHRCDADGTENEQGEHIRVVLSASITSLNSKNTAAYTLKYKKSTATSYTSVSLSALANTYAVTDWAYIFAADSNSSYDVEVEAKDRHGTATRSTSASTAFTLMNWGPDGTSLAFGKVAEKANTLQIALDVEFLGKLSGTILDALLPVNSVVIRYDHVNPGTLYPGTTWVRIYGAFPWFTDGDGQIGLTGGERTHTLTVNEMPKHNHGGTYTNAGDATKTHAWLASGGSSMAYASIDAGGGAAHNNMPPYIQVSAWRRTA